MGVYEYSNPPPSYVRRALSRERGESTDSLSVKDLVVFADTFAAIAEMAQLTVPRDDKDFELIADITGQPIERLTLDPCPDRVVDGKG